MCHESGIYFYIIWQNCISMGELIGDTISKPVLKIVEFGNFGKTWPRYP
jgi:hypothetical protein